MVWALRLESEVKKESEHKKRSGSGTSDLDGTESQRIVTEGKEMTFIYLPLLTTKKYTLKIKKHTYCV